MRSLCLPDKFSQWYKRLRHRKGFGIHSPFAFMLVKEIVDCRCRYYGYDDIEAFVSATSNSRLARKDARLLIRIIGRMPIERFVVSADNDMTSLMSSVVKVANSRLKVSEMPIDGAHNLVYVSNKIYDTKVLRNLLSKDGNWVIFRGLKNEDMNNWYRSIVADCHHGVVFEDTDISIVVTNHKMPLVKYTMMI